MKWISVKDYLPGEDVFWVIVRVLNAYDCDFYYQAMYLEDQGIWEFWNELDWPEGHATEQGYRVTHWCIPDEVEDDE